MSFPFDALRRTPDVEGPGLVAVDAADRLILDESASARGRCGDGELVAIGDSYGALALASAWDGGLGVRVDSALYSGYTVPPHYDSLVAKLVVHAPSRPEAIARMRRALNEMVVAGIRTTLPLHQAVMDDPEFQSGDYTIHWLERFVAARQG